MQDGFDNLNLPGEQLRGRIRIQYVDHYGEVEAGVDGGGLFKDFMENLMKEGFDPRIGLFNTTPEQKLYPNPAAAVAVADAFALFQFLGKMLGKALYEVIAQKPGQVNSCSWLWCLTDEHNAMCMLQTQYEDLARGTCAEFPLIICLPDKPVANHLVISNMSKRKLDVLPEIYSWTFNRRVCQMDSRSLGDCNLGCRVSCWSCRWRASS